MNKVLIYGGTTEARILAEELAKAKITCLVFVATEYGEAMMDGQNPYLHMHVGRLTAEEMADFYDAEKPDAIVDATHPYAEAVKENIHKSLQERRTNRDIPFFRIYREEEPRADVRGARYFGSVEDCAEALKKTNGKIFLTTGSKSLPIFTQDESLRRRLTVRVLPSLESLEICRDCGIPGNRIIAMQGPFSEEMNREMLRAADSDILVLKESGKPGGEASRIAAAQKLGVDCYIISRPTEKIEGHSLPDVLDQLLELFGWKTRQRNRLEGTLHQNRLDPEACNRDRLRGLDEVNSNQGANGIHDNHNPHSNNRKKTSNSLPSTRVAPRTVFWEISLIGIGMASSVHLTKEAEEALGEADFLFGAPRMIDSISGFDPDRLKFPYYTADRILPTLSDLSDTAKTHVKSYSTPIVTLRAAILFSGDTGFYSGCAKLYAKLQNLENTSVRILPGISSVSAMAAACGVSWQDAAILSTHGIPAREWIPRFVDATRHQSRTFCITSGSRDIRTIGNLLLESERFFAARNGAHTEAADVLSVQCGTEADSAAKTNDKADDNIGKQNSGDLAAKCLPESSGSYEITIGRNLGDETERILHLAAEDCIRLDEPGLYTVLVENNNPAPRRVSPGSVDDVFTRGKTPMTKEEIRALSICKLRLDADSVVYDIGCGTGSVSCDIAALSPEIQVYSVDMKPEATELTRFNAAKLRLMNVAVHEGTAPECLVGLPAPTHVFVGGSNGNLRNVIEYLKTFGTRIRVVVTAVSLETVSELTQLVKKIESGDMAERVDTGSTGTVATGMDPNAADDTASRVIVTNDVAANADRAIWMEKNAHPEVELVQVSVSRSRRLGSHHLMTAENPVYIASFTIQSEG